jgi:hypothetical protein
MKHNFNTVTSSTAQWNLKVLLYIHNWFNSWVNIFTESCLERYRWKVITHFSIQVAAQGPNIKKVFSSDFASYSLEKFWDSA